eukprot:GHVU01035932.1.p1 GENE.GHVU01035932.1~~GHVU01035932.1.p1  ORF type:complete len:205 (+),score=6.59 GHVU01035932.1:347-961(+)
MIQIDGGAAVHVHLSTPMHLSSLLPLMTTFTRTQARTQTRQYTRRQVRAQARIRARARAQIRTFKPHCHTRTCLHTRTGSRVWGEAKAGQVQGKYAIRHALPQRHSCALHNFLSSFSPLCHSFLSSLHFHLGSLSQPPPPPLKPSHLENPERKFPLYSLLFKFIVCDRPSSLSFARVHAHTCSHTGGGRRAAPSTPRVSAEFPG